MLTKSYAWERLRGLETEIAGRVADAAAALVSIRLRSRSSEAASESSRAAAELARGSDTSEQFVRDWLVVQESDAYIVFDPRTGRYANLRRAV